MKTPQVRIGNTKMALTALQRKFLNSFNSTQSPGSKPSEDEEEYLHDSNPSHEKGEEHTSNLIDNFLSKDSLVRGKVSLHAQKEEPTNSSDEDVSSIGIAARGAIKDVPNSILDLPFLPHNVASSLFRTDNNRYLFSKERMGEKEVADPRTGEIITPVDAAPFSWGVGEKAAELFDKVTDKKYIPQNEEEQKIADYAGLLASIFTPGGAKSIISSALKSASSLKAGTKAIGELIKKISPDVVKKAAEPVGETLSKVGNFITRPGTKADAIVAPASKFITDEVTENLDMDSPLNRAVALALGIGSDVGLRKAGNVAEGALFNKLISKKKLDLANKYDQNPETSQLLNDNTRRGNAVQFMAQNIADNPFVGGDVRKNRIENIDDIQKELKLDNVKVKDPEGVEKHVRGAINDFKKERIEESRKLYSKAFGELDTPKTSEKFDPIKRTSDLNGDDFQHRVNDYLAQTRGDKKSQAFFSASPDDRIKILDEFAHSDQKNKKQFKIHDGENTIHLETDKRNIRRDTMVPNHLLEEIQKNSDLIGVPPQIKNLIEHVKRNNGTISVENYERYRKMLNKIKRPSGDSFYDAEAIRKFRDATRNDMKEKLGSLSGDRVKAFEDFLSYHSDWYKENPKKLVQNKLVQMEEDSGNRIFKKVYADFKTDNKLKNSYFSKLTQKGAEKLSKEIYTEMAFHPDTKSVNLFKWAREYNNLTKDQQHFQQQLHNKANPGTKTKLTDVSDLILQAKSTYHHANTSKTAIHTAFNKLIMPDTQITNAGKDLNRFNNFKWTHIPLYAAKNIVVPIAAKLAAKKYLLDPKFIEWVAKSNDIKGTTQFLKWVNDAGKYEFLSKPTMNIIQKTFLDKMQEVDHDER